MGLSTDTPSFYYAYQSFPQNSLSQCRFHHTVHTASPQVSNDLVLPQMGTLALLPDLMPLFALFSLKQLLDGHLPHALHCGLLVWLLRNQHSFFKVQLLSDNSRHIYWGYLHLTVWCSINELKLIFFLPANFTSGLFHFCLMIVLLPVY